jgi:hypothetical protein
MATSTLSSGMQSTVAEYDIFWQLWPQFEQAGGERRLIGLEVELIGSHTPDLNHLDLACPRCGRVRSVLLDIANRIVQQTALNFAVIHDIDSHANSILCLPALGNRSLVSVSVNLSWTDATDRGLDTELLSAVKDCLAKCGIHQR